MANRANATIIIGGAMSQAQYDGLCDALGGDVWETMPTDAQPGAHNLYYFDDEVAWGRFEEIETYCPENGLPFARWCGAFPGEWNAERVVYTGVGEPQSFSADDTDRIVIDAETLEKLGNMEAVRAWFARAEFQIPPFSILDEADTGSADKLGEASDVGCQPD